MADDGSVASGWAAVSGDEEVEDVDAGGLEESGYVDGAGGVSEAGSEGACDSDSV